MLNSKAHNAFSKTPHRVSHTRSTSNNIRSIPHTSKTRASASGPAPLTGLSGKCASCGGGKRRR